MNLSKRILTFTLALIMMFTSFNGVFALSGDESTVEVSAFSYDRSGSMVSKNKLVNPKAKIEKQNDKYYVTIALKDMLGSIPANIEKFEVKFPDENAYKEITKINGDKEYPQVYKIELGKQRTVIPYRVTVKNMNNPMGGVLILKWKDQPEKLQINPAFNVEGDKFKVSFDNPIMTSNILEITVNGTKYNQDPDRDNFSFNNNEIVMPKDRIIKGENKIKIITGSYGEKEYVYKTEGNYTDGLGIEGISLGNYGESIIVNGKELGEFKNGVAISLYYDGKDSLYNIMQNVDKVYIDGQYVPNRDTDNKLTFILYNGNYIIFDIGEYGSKTVRGFDERKPHRVAILFKNGVKLEKQDDDYVGPKEQIDKKENNTETTKKLADGHEVSEVKIESDKSVIILLKEKFTHEMLDNFKEVKVNDTVFDASQFYKNKSGGTLISENDPFYNELTKNKDYKLEIIFNDDSSIKYPKDKNENNTPEPSKPKLPEKPKVEKKIADGKEIEKTDIKISNWSKKLGIYLKGGWSKDLFDKIKNVEINGNSYTKDNFTFSPYFSDQIKYENDDLIELLSKDDKLTVKVIFEDDSSITNVNTNVDKFYKVKFIKHDSPILKDKFIKDGETILKPDDPTKEGFKFIGWFVGDEKYDFSEPVTSNLIIEAKWEALDNDITVNFDTDGGSEIAPVKVKKGSTVEKPEDPIKDNTVFMYWTLNGKKYDFSEAVNENITLKAKWRDKNQGKISEGREIEYAKVYKPVWSEIFAIKLNPTIDEVFIKENIKSIKINGTLLDRDTVIGNSSVNKNNELESVMDIFMKAAKRKTPVEVEITFIDDSKLVYPKQEPKQEVDKSKLIETLNEYDSLDKEKYTGESLNVYTDAYNKAKKVKENKDSTVEDVTNAINALKEAKNSLVEKQKEEPKKGPFDNLADGEYTIGFKAINIKDNEESSMAGYFDPNVKLVVNNEKKTLSFLNKQNADVLLDFAVKDGDFKQATRNVISKTNSGKDEKVEYTFELNDLNKVYESAVLVTIGANANDKGNYDKYKNFKLQFTEPVEKGWNGYEIINEEENALKNNDKILIDALIEAGLDRNGDEKISEDEWKKGKTLRKDKVDNIYLTNYLDLSNKKLTDISMLKKLGGKIDGIDLSGNNIEELPKDLFKNTNNLKYLNLTNNNITKIDKDAFSGLTNLRILDMESNPFTEVPGELLKNSTRLRVFAMPNTKIKTLPENIFANNNKLEEVYLRECYDLEKLPDNIFSNNHELKSVHLWRCNLNNLPKSLSEAKYLNILDAHDNNIREIPKELSKVKKLKKLDLSYNYIENISSDLVKSMLESANEDIADNIVALNLKDNFIFNFPVDEAYELFKDKKGLTNIELNLNYLKDNLTNDEIKKYKKLGVKFDSYPEIYYPQKTHGSATLEAKNGNVVLKSDLSITELYYWDLGEQSDALFKTKEEFLNYVNNKARNLHGIAEGTSREEAIKDILVDRTESFFKVVNVLVKNGKVIDEKTLESPIENLVQAFADPTMKKGDVYTLYKTIYAKDGISLGRVALKLNAVCEEATFTPTPEIKKYEKYAKAFKIDNENAISQMDSYINRTVKVEEVDSKATYYLTVNNFGGEESVSDLWYLKDGNKVNTEKTVDENKNVTFKITTEKPYTDSFKVKMYVVPMKSEVGALIKLSDEKPKEESKKVDKTKLEKAIKEFNELEKDKYTEDSINAYENAVNKAKAVNENEKATEEEVKTALEKLEKAKKALVEKPKKEDSKKEEANKENPKKDEHKKDNNKENKIELKPETKYEDKVFYIPSASSNSNSDLKVGKVNALPSVNKTSKEVKKEEPKKEEVKKETNSINSNFKDISNHWAKNAIDYVVSKGYFAGTSENTFTPNRAITRGEFVTVLGRMLNIEKTKFSTNKFNDVTTSDFFAPYVAWAEKNGITKGIGDGKFAPNKELTREEMAVMMTKFLEVSGKNFNKYVKSEFKDEKEIANWAKDAVRQISEEGIVKGMEDGNFAPKSPFTRAQVAQVLYNIDHK